MPTIVRTSDPVKAPKHYLLMVNAVFDGADGAIEGPALVEVKDIIAACPLLLTNHYAASATEYLLRASRKGNLEDLRKAAECLNIWLKQTEDAAKAANEKAH